MDTYREYVVRCKTCNEPIACHAHDYEELLNAGVTVEDALNELGIMDYCSRIAMMNPSVVAFNMENRAVIEGFKSVDAVTEDEIQEESTSQPIFSSCVGAGNLNPTVNPLAAPQLTGIPITLGTRVPPNAPGVQTHPMQLRQPITGMQTLGLMQPTARPVVVAEIKPILPLDQTLIGNAPAIIPGMNLTQNILGTQNDVSPLLGVGIAVNIPDRMNNKFEEPTIVGVPTINPDITVAQPTVYVGAGKSAHILNGRTYLAQ